MLAFGYSGPKVAKFLSEQEGERYYFENGRIWRASKLPPYEPHLIKEV
jgi:hypothetical protein